MTGVETHTIETQYGSTTIETYDCDSCGNTVAYENTVPFTIGETEGRACEHCEENGPISFPKRVAGEDASKHVIATPILLPLILLVGFAEESGSFDKGYATAVVSLLVWVGIPAILWVVL